MSSTSSTKPRALLDTTVLCGALCTDGVNRQLLRLGWGSLYYQPVLSRVTLFEMYNVAINKGLRGVRYSSDDIEAFMQDVVSPLLENNTAVNSVIGRYHVLSKLYEHRPTGEVLAELSGCTQVDTVEIIRTAGMDQPLSHYDPEDMHVWLSAIQEKCDYMVTSNTRRFPECIGRIQRIHPKEFLFGIIGFE